MATAGTDAPADETTVLVCAPTGRDAALIGRLLENGGVRSRLLADPASLASAVGAGGGPAIVASEAVRSGSAARSLKAALDREPAWSETPLIFLLNRSRSPGGEARRLMARPSSTQLVRPVEGPTLLGVARAAAAARRKQLEVRDLLNRLETLNRRLETRAGQLRRLALRAAEAEERERERISRLLHDHLQQVLMACQMQLSLLRRSGDGGGEHGRRLEELLKEATLQTRSLTVNLTPPVLHDASLTEALDWLADKMAVDHALRVKLAVPAPVDVRDARVRTLLFEAARELLMNVVKHARVGWCRLGLRRREDGSLVLTVEDEGVGCEAIDVHALRGSGLGLFRMSERVTHIGGNFRVRCAPNQGCRVELTIPASALDGGAAAAASGSGGGGGG